MSDVREKQNPELLKQAQEIDPRIKKLVVVYGGAKRSEICYWLDLPEADGFNNRRWSKSESGETTEQWYQRFLEVIEFRSKL
jgi:hypothetical protein